jgi:hypothetical protein
MIGGWRRKRKGEPLRVMRGICREGGRDEVKRERVGEVTKRMRRGRGQGRERDRKRGERGKGGRERE